MPSLKNSKQIQKIEWELISTFRWNSRHEKNTQNDNSTSHSDVKNNLFISYESHVSSNLKEWTFNISGNSMRTEKFVHWS